MKSKVILLAEDDPKDVELILAALEEYKLINNVVVVSDGVEALDYLFRKGRFAERGVEEPVVILLDLKMPRVDGLEVLRRVKSDCRLKTIPVVVLTSSREESDIVESYDLGVNAYVVKPVEFSAFIESVKRTSLFWLLTNEVAPSRKSCP